MVPLKKLCAGMTVGLALVTSVLPAADNEKTLTDKGLKKSGSVYALPDEGQIEAKMKDAIKVKAGKIAPAQKQQKTAEQAVDVIRKQMEAGKKFLDNIEVEIPKAPSAAKHNQMVSDYRKAEKKMEELQTQLEAAEKTAKEKRNAVMQAAEEYNEHLLQARKLYDKIAKQYKGIATEKEVTDALAALNAADAKAKLKLGPTAAMLATGTKLKNLEDQVFSEAIPIKQGQGGLWSIGVMFNNKSAVELEIDTGASSVVLPFKLAKELGLEPGYDAPTVRGQLANGSIVEGKKVMAPRIRVGRFVVDDVECLVFGPEYDQASALLGQSFLSHFVYKIDSVNAKLVMTKLETPEERKAAKARGDVDDKDGDKKDADTKDADKKDADKKDAKDSDGEKSPKGDAKKGDKKKKDDGDFQIDP
jgi:clan AA aspartic protease (TIGR02281 family)